MPIEFRCVGCSKLLRTPDESAGKKAKCPQCGAIVDVPAGDTTQTDATSPFESSQQFGMTPEIPDPGTNPFAVMDGTSGVRDSENPYASPRLTDDVHQAKPMTAAALTHTKMSFEDVLSTSTTIMIDNLGPMAIFGVVLFGVNIGLAAVNQAMSFGANLTNEPVVIIATQFVSMAVNICAQTWMGIVSILFCTRMVRDRQANMNVLSQAGPHFGRAVVLTMVLSAIFLLLILLFCGTPAAIAWIITRDIVVTLVSAGVGLLVCLIPIVLVVLNYLLAMFFIVDRQAGVFDAMGLSRKFMRSNKMQAFVILFVVYFLGFFFIAFTCCTGRIIYDPFAALVSAVMYMIATGQPFERPLK